jgi:hypothetical protein
MGWYYTQGASRADIIAELLVDTTHRTIAHSARSNRLWAVREYERDGKPVRYIALYLLRGDRDGWGYKPMDETVGPCEKDCPLKFLDLASPDPSGYAKQWREEVRAYHAAQRAKRALIKALKPGSVLQLVKGCNPPFVEIRSVKPLRGTYEGRMYRVSPRCIPVVPPAAEASTPAEVAT